MFSSTVSSAATITGTKSNASIRSSQIESLCKNRPFYEPQDYFDGRYIYDIYENPLIGKKKKTVKTRKKKLPKKNYGPICNLERQYEDEAINEWKEREFKKDKRF